MNIILIGKSGSGKSTLSKYIIEQYHFNKYSLGDNVKKFISDLTLVLHNLNHSNELIKLDDLYDVNIKNNYRKHMQLIATDLCQTYFGKTCWCKSINPVGNYIIDDCRFIHEYEYFKNKDTKVIKIERNNENNFEHISETEILNYIKPDLIIKNNDSINDLYKQFDNWFKNITTNK